MFCVKLQNVCYVAANPDLMDKYGYEFWTQRPPKPQNPLQTSNSQKSCIGYRCFLSYSSSDLLQPNFVHLDAVRLYCYSQMVMSRPDEYALVVPRIAVRHRLEKAAMKQQLREFTVAISVKRMALVTKMKTNIDVFL